MSDDAGIAPGRATHVAWGPWLKRAGRGVIRPKTRLRPSGHGSDPPCGEESEAEAGASFLAGETSVFWGGHPGSPAPESRIEPLN
jgi:hypothetical protein